MEEYIFELLRSLNRDGVSNIDYGFVKDATTGELGDVSGYPSQMTGMWLWLYANEETFGKEERIRRDFERYFDLSFETTEGNIVHAYKIADFDDGL